MDARDMINELLDIIEEVGNINIVTEEGKDFEFKYSNWLTDCADVELKLEE